MTDELQNALDCFADDLDAGDIEAVIGALLITHLAGSAGLPLDPESLFARSGGQVPLRAQNHALAFGLLSTSGDTRKRKLIRTRQILALFNRAKRSGMIEAGSEAYLSNLAYAVIADKPLTIDLGASRSLRHIVGDIYEQALERQEAAPGFYQAGAVLLHLVGAALKRAAGKSILQHSPFSSRDTSAPRAADFMLHSMAVHATASPSEALIRRCRENLKSGFMPVIVTTTRGTEAAAVLADNQGLIDRIDIFEIEQFVAQHLYGTSQFTEHKQRGCIADLVDCYNDIVHAVEPEPCLRIEILTEALQ